MMAHAARLILGLVVAAGYALACGPRDATDKADVLRQRARDRRATSYGASSPVLRNGVPACAWSCRSRRTRRISAISSTCSGSTPARRRRTCCSSTSSGCRSLRRPDGFCRSTRSSPTCDDFFAGRARGRSLERRALRAAVVRRRRHAVLAHAISLDRGAAHARRAARRWRCGCVRRDGHALRAGLAGRALRRARHRLPRAPRGVRRRGFSTRAGAWSSTTPAAIRALDFMRERRSTSIASCRSAALTWQEEQTRFAFQNGEAAFMRNWPYAWTLLQDESRSRVARRFAVAPFPAGDGRPARRGARRRRSWRSTPGATSPTLAFELVAFLTAPEQMLERARLAGTAAAAPFAVRHARSSPRRCRFRSSRFAQVLEAAVPRPATPVYSELSEILQVRIHRALTRAAARRRRPSRRRRARCARCWRAPACPPEGPAQ